LKESEGRLPAGIISRAGRGREKGYGESHVHKEKESSPYGKCGLQKPGEDERRRTFLPVEKSITPEKIKRAKNQEHQFYPGREGDNICIRRN